MSDGKHRTWFNYAPLSTAGTDMKDDGSRVFSSVTIERGGSKKPLELAFIGDEANLELIRVKTPDTDGNLDAEDVRIIGSITEHAITILRLLFNQDIGPLYLAGRTPLFGQFGNDHDGSPQLNVRAEEIRSPPKYDADQIRNAIVATAPIRVLLTLIDEARRPTSPLPFKYLSYYKILELEFRSDRKWNGLQEHLSQYGNEYRKLEIGQASLINVLHSFRDKCAHIKTGGRDEIGLVGMGSKDAGRIVKFLPLLNKIVVDHINTKYSHIIGLRYDEPLSPSLPPDQQVVVEPQPPGDKTS